MEGGASALPDIRPVDLTDCGGASILPAGGEKVGKYWVTTLRGRKLVPRKAEDGKAFVGTLRDLERRLRRLTSFNYNHVVKTRRVLEAVEQSHGSGIAKEVRFLATLRYSGFKEVNLEDVSFEMVARAAGVTVKLEGRQVFVEDSVGKQSFLDDYYHTGLRYIFGDLSNRTGVVLPVVDERAVNSVRRVCGQEDPHSWLVERLKDGTYHTHRVTRFYGSKGLEKLRPLVLRDFSLTATEVDLKRLSVKKKPVTLLLLEPAEILKSLRSVVAADAFRCQGFVSKEENKVIKHEVKRMVGSVANFTEETFEALIRIGHRKKAIVGFLCCNFTVFTDQIQRSLVRASSLFDE